MKPLYNSLDSAMPVHQHNDLDDDLGLMNAQNAAFNLHGQDAYPTFTPD